jgi:hypothetical protein
MSYDPNEIIVFVAQLLRSSSDRKNLLTEMEKFLISSIVQGITYRQASIKYQYTESSFQNAASHLFKEISDIIGIPVNRRNFTEIIGKEYSQAKVLAEAGDILFEQIQASFWILSNRAKLISISYHANRILNITQYLSR